MFPDDLKYWLANKFTSASCSSSYIGEICRHFKTRTEEHIKKDNKSHIFEHPTPPNYALARIILSFKIIDNANSN